MCCHRGLRCPRLRLGSEGRVSREGLLSQGCAVPQSQDLSGDTPRPGTVLASAFGLAKPERPEVGVVLRLAWPSLSRNTCGTETGCGPTFPWRPPPGGQWSCSPAHVSTCIVPTCTFQASLAVEPSVEISWSHRESSSCPKLRGQASHHPAWGTPPCSPEELPGLLDSGLRQGLGHFLCRGSGPIW